MGAIHYCCIAVYDSVANEMKLFGTGYNPNENELMRHDGVFAQHTADNDTISLGMV